MSSVQPQHLSHPKYRPDIDGLRAIAVLSVIIFHAFPSWVKGGFIGVDVFFVISGYLISTIIFENLDRNTFNFAEFYARRIRRIFPALLLVIAASYAFGWLALLPGDYKQLGKHIFAGASFISNFILWNESGYFDSSAETKPLLHLWSLGIEEQFYIIWPMFLWLSFNLKLNNLKLIALVALISFLLNIKMTEQDAVAAFYSPQTRFWELQCGSLLALVTLYKKSVFAVLKNSKRLSAILSLTGFLLLIYGLLYLNQKVRFPGGWALVPVFGAVLLISAGPQGLVNRIVLSNNMVVWLGLISYPLYLWHWPLLSFARIVEGDVPGNAIRTEAVILAVVLAWLTYKFIERPLRFGQHSKSKVAGLVILMSVLGYMGYYTYKHNGLESRFPEIVQELTGYKYDYKVGYREGTCFLRPEQDYTEFAKCADETALNKPNVLLWGDSHAAHLYPGYKARYGKNINIIQRTASACPPILNYEVMDRIHCKNINDYIWKTVRKGKLPDSIVLAGTWMGYGLDNKELLAKLDGTIMQIQQLGIRKIDFIGPVPYWKGNLTTQLLRYYKEHIPHTIPERMSFGLDEKFIVDDELLRQHIGKLGVRYISARDILCDQNGCLTRVGNTGDTITTWDVVHLTTKGSEFLVANFPSLQ